MHDQIAQGLRDHPAKKGLPFNILVTILEIGGRITLFHVGQRMGASDVVSYLVGSIAPVLGGFAIWIKARKFSGASAAIFTFTFISAGIALVGSTAPKVLLYKDCAATALIGLVFLGSCVLAHKPVVFYMAQRYGTDGTRDGMSTFDTMWDTYPRLPQRHIRHQLPVGGVVRGPSSWNRADHPSRRPLQPARRATRSADQHAGR